MGRDRTGDHSTGGEQQQNEADGSRLEDPALHALGVSGELSEAHHEDTGDIRAETNDLEAALNPGEQSTADDAVTDDPSDLEQAEAEAG
jgi:hypothetical protein